MVKVHQLHKIKIVLPITAEADFDAVSDLVIILVIGGRHIRGAEIAAEVAGDLHQLLPGDDGIQARQSLPQYLREYAFLLAAASRTVRQRFTLVRGRGATQNIILERSTLQLLQDRLFDIVFGYEVARFATSLLR